MAHIKQLRAITEEFTMGKELGRGTYGTVHLCSRSADPKARDLVIKIIDVTKSSRKNIADYIKEAKLLQMFDHPNIVKFVDYFSTPDTLCIVQEFCNANDLAHEVKVMRKNKTLFREDVIWTWFLQLSCAVKHIHDRKILHRDIKTANIFMHQRDAGGWPIVKLGDFGISKALEQTHALAKSTVGTPYYMSPELCDNKPYSFKSDVWAIGVVLYELATLKQPFDSHNFNGLVLKILKGRYHSPPESYSRDLHQMIRCLLSNDEGKRPDMTEVLKMPVCKDKIFKSGIAVDVLQREFAHTVLHGFKPCDVLSRPTDGKKSPGDNMSKLYGALDDVENDPELVYAPSNTARESFASEVDDWERHRENMEALENGGDKFLLLGRTLNLPGVTANDSRHARIEALRIFLEKQLGAQTFLTVYTIMSAVSEGDDEDVLEQQLCSIVGERNMHFLCLVAQLIFCEEKANEDQNASL